MAGHLIGIAHVTLGEAHPLAPEDSQVELLRLDVQELFTGKRIGTQLLTVAERSAIEAGAEILWLTPWVYDYRGIGSYSSRRYKDCGLTHFMFEGESHENRFFAKSLAATLGAA